jgi:hypothetical protein
VSVTIELTSQEILQLKQLTRQTGDSEAVNQAVREFLRMAHLRQLKSASGKVDFVDPSVQLESLEIDECPFPE